MNKLLRCLKRGTHIFMWFAVLKHTRNSMLTAPLNKCLQNMFTDCIDVVVDVHGTSIIYLFRYTGV